MATLKALLFVVAASSNSLTKVFAVEGMGAPIPGYSVETLHPRGAPIILDGTIEPVNSKAKQLSPRLDQIKPNRIECADGKRWKKVHRWHILDGMKYLDNISAKPTIGPGPGNCSRVSCSYGAAIWWCNDNSEKLELNSFKDIADGAIFIMDECVSFGFMMDRAGGQAFMPGNWNVIVRQDHC
ncbi:hypothetical protein E4U13_007129 [Claviceps humidiphila]|uniref:Ecp2 effector protein domain-containing protein n=1 Tax=Claviceps humidiphila TaxID=1294629 RepID=A0A9P7PYI6_9HYPO|nr:hypothetical protein E4U13_007129 [Claviceps humidiphila]